MNNIKWGRVIVWIVLGTAIAFLIANGFMLVTMVIRGIQYRGAPPREEQIAFVVGPVYNGVAIVATALGALIGGRAVARKAEGGHTLSGLVIGIGVGLLSGLYAILQRGEFTFWSPLHLVLGIAGGYLGGVLGAKRAQADEMYD
jgi:hypothetical protein